MHRMKNAKTGFIGFREALRRHIAFEVTVRRHCLKFHIIRTDIAVLRRRELVLVPGFAVFIIDRSCYKDCRALGQRPQLAVRGTCTAAYI